MPRLTSQSFLHYSRAAASAAKWLLKQTAYWAFGLLYYLTPFLFLPNIMPAGFAASGAWWCGSTLALLVLPKVQPGARRSVIARMLVAGFMLVVGSGFSVFACYLVGLLAGAILSSAESSQSEERDGSGD